MTDTAKPREVGCNEGLGPLVERLRACSIDPMWADHAEVPKNLSAAAADMLDAARAVGVRQEQIIMDHEREIARLRAGMGSLIRERRGAESIREGLQSLMRGGPNVI